MSAIIPRGVFSDPLFAEDVPEFARDGLSISQFAGLYLAHVSASTAPARAEALGWTFDVMDALVARHPDLALDAILHSIAIATTAKDIGIMAAGALEDLVAQNGEHVIARIEQTAQNSKRFRYALFGVWPQGRKDTHVWARIAKARGAGPDMDKGELTF